jgi:hypothetical protein
MKLKTALLSLFFIFSGALFAHDEHMTAPTMPKEFDQLKTLIGTWEGTGKMGENTETITVTYELTSGGTAIVEKLMPGTPHEMISVYHKNGKDLSMTHYCALGNAPVMNLKKADGKTMTFEMTKADGVTSMKEPHMHALTLTTAGDTLTQEWVNFENGKKKGVTTFTLKRKA